VDITQAAGTGTYLDLPGGRKLHILPTRLKHIAMIVTWARSQLPNPIAAVVEAFGQPAALERDLVAGRALATYEKAAAVTAKAHIDRITELRKAKQPIPVEMLGPPPPPDDTEVCAAAKSAREWFDLRRDLMMRAYEAKYPGPTLGDPAISSVLGTPEGKCYELWTAMQEDPAMKAQYATHLDLMAEFDDHPGVLNEAWMKLAQLNSLDDDPKVSSGTATTAAPGAATETSTGNQSSAA
jgi:hypothetical protein